MLSAFRELVLPISPSFPLFTLRTKNYDGVDKVSFITGE